MILKRNVIVGFVMAVCAWLLGLSVVSCGNLIRFDGIHGDVVTLKRIIKGTPGKNGKPGTPGLIQRLATSTPGVTGPRGRTGSQGRPGDPGAPGVGQTGPQGATGSQGVAGSAGERGPRGFGGPRGAVGPRGPTGQRGPAGIPGIPGVSPTIQQIIDQLCKQHPLVCTLSSLPSGLLNHTTKGG